ncbi:LAFA_0F08262g1_1 [Lachancea sp. 'fantastica']|nr:LAFA_0F08262g1_1 [Lachancea sp. 'fantastica']
MSSGELMTAAVGRSADVNSPETTEEINVAQESASATERIKQGLTSRLKFVGRKFNVLDSLFSKNNRTESLQYGANADGVFSNLTAKPDNTNRGEQGESDKPPNYDEAALDMAPSYYGVDDDNFGMYSNEICFEGLPVGNAVNLLWNIIVSVSFQFVGFLLTYILHTSHAAKQGSRFGLGLTFLGYGYSMIPNDITAKVGKSKNLDRLKPSDPNEYDDMHLYTNSAAKDMFESSLSHGGEEEKRGVPFLAIVLFLSGAFIMTKSIYDYVKVKRKEKQYFTQEPV